MSEIKKESVFDFFEGEEILLFLRKFLDLQKKKISEKDCLEWSCGVCETVEELIQENDLCEDLNYDSKELLKALIFAYCSHWSFERRDGKSYLVHIEGALLNVLYFLIEEKKLREKTELENKKITNIKKMTRVFVKTILHDVLEEIFQVLTLNQKDKKNMEKSERIELLNKQIDFIKELKKMLHLIFDSDVADSLLYVFTNFSERPVTAYHIERGDVGDLNKEDWGRVDLLGSVLAIQNEEDLDVKSADKSNNLETVDQMGGTKMLEIYNFIYMLFATRKRAKGKFMLINLHYYLDGRGCEVGKKFKEILTQKEELDLQNFNCYKTALESDLDKLYGQDNYELRYHELGEMRVHEMVMNEYYRQKGNEKRFLSDGDPMGHYFVTEEILNDPVFKQIFAEVLTGRVVVLVNADFEDFHRVRAESLAFESFEIFKRTDYFGGEGNDKLRASEYKADSVILKPQGEIFVKKDSSMQKVSLPFMNLKFMTRADDYYNEYGDNTYFGDFQRTKNSQVFTNTLKQIRDMLGDENYSIFKYLTYEACGSNPLMKIGEIVGLKSEKLSDESKKKMVWEVLKEVSEAVKCNLFLEKFLETL